ncbi:hypothetical protein EMEDMD4_620087 [Sinorhizobium medicae]|uniref:Uncharacterized protein n=1 Tax=Sinorhizobium medicae TaxID=110321 RepID=A0A508X9K8_9HYPH|nr:hypothetical protein EMEDMD4_620087 [Sinorhizobium medicae]
MPCDCPRPRCNANDRGLGTRTSLGRFRGPTPPTAIQGLTLGLPEDDEASDPGTMERYVAAIFHDGRPPATAENANHRRLGTRTSLGQFRAPTPPAVILGLDPRIHPRTFETEALPQHHCTRRTIHGPLRCEIVRFPMFRLP